MIESGSNGWDKLPNEVLEGVSRQIEYTFEEKNARYAFYQKQLVCKSWHGIANYQLYKNVYLSLDETVMDKFVSETIPRFGDLVKSIEFYANKNSQTKYPVNADQNLDIILKSCPNIEKIGSLTEPTFGTQYIWKRLLAAPEDQCKHLKAFASSDEWTVQDKDMYTKLCFKYKDTITDIRLFPDGTINQDGEVLSLIKNLKGFKSLKQLQIDGCLVYSSIIADLDDTLNDWNNATHALQLKLCNLSSIQDYPGEMNPNHDIKQLQLISPKLPASSVRYFAKKLAALKTLELTTVNPNPIQSRTEEEHAEWWNQMTDLCQPLENYNISMNEFSPATYLHQIRGAAKLSSTIANRTTPAALAEFIMRFGDSDTNERKYIVEMKQNGSYVCLFNSRRNPEFMESAKNFDQIFKSMQLFPTNTVRILNLEQHTHFDDLFKRYNTEFASENAFNSYLVQWYNKRNWAIFDGAISLINNQTRSVVHLDKMLFPGTCQETSSAKASVSELKFTNSLLYANVFPDLSSKLEKVGTLILEDCIIKSHSLDKLEISLPATELGHFELNLNRVFHSGSCFQPVGCHTVAVTTDANKTTTYRYNECRAYREITGTTEDAGNFVFSIKCKRLESLAISGIKVF